MGGEALEEGEGVDVVGLEVGGEVGVGLKVEVVDGVVGGGGGGGEVGAEGEE